MSTNVPNLKQIGGGHRKTLVDLTWNDPLCKCDKLMFSRRRRGETVVAPRRAAATRSQSAAPTVLGVCPRTKQSRSLSSGISWKLLQCVTSQTPPSTKVIHCRGISVHEGLCHQCCCLRVFLALKFSCCNF